jgi:LysR family transcriptional regulator, glycine cleavage system transcriptional activator
MSMKLPPIAAIRAFEAAARHQSFTKAAGELGMTQAAVSYQIRLLEDRVGTSLFTREPRQVTLTPMGRRLSPKVTEALDLLGAAFAEVAEKSRLNLAISILPTVASGWLVPHLASFQAANPNIQIRLHTSNDLVDFAKDDIDMVVRSGDGAWPGNDVFPLFPMEYAPVCTPEFRDRNRLTQPSDLLAVRRFGSPNWWRRWLTEAGVENMDEGNRMGLVLGVQAMDVAVTLLGQGVAMVVPTFFAEELKSGRLVQPFTHIVKDGRGYFLVYPEARRRSRKVQLFRDWIIAEAEATRSTVAIPA